MSKQPEALRLADALEDDLEQYDGLSLPPSSQAIADSSAAELRRLHAINRQLLDALFGIEESTHDTMTATLARVAIDKATRGYQ
jgi:hypothetical protein